MRRLLVLVLAVSAFSATQPARAGEAVSVGELLENSASYEGREIILTGELVGDYGARPDGTVWTQLNDDSYATSPVLEGGLLAGANVGVGIRGTADQFRGLDPPGRYTVRGPLVRAVGTWRYHDENRSGESYLDVLSLEVVEPGRRMTEPVDAWVLAVGVILVAATAVPVVRASRLLRRD